MQSKGVLSGLAISFAQMRLHRLLHHHLLLRMMGMFRKIVATVVDRVRASEAVQVGLTEPQILTSTKILERAPVLTPILAKRYLSHRRRRPHRQSPNGFLVGSRKSMIGRMQFLGDRNDRRTYK
jgi:hypothetical protein